MGLVTTKPVFRVTKKWDSNLLSYRDELEKKRILFVASLDMILIKMQLNKGADQSAQMHRLGCASFITKPLDRFSGIDVLIIDFNKSCDSKTKRHIIQ